MKGPPLAVKRLYWMYGAKAVISVEDAMAIHYLHLHAIAVSFEIAAKKFFTVNTKEFAHTYLFLLCEGDRGNAMTAMAAPFALENLFFHYLIPFRYGIGS